MNNKEKEYIVDCTKHLLAGIQAKPFVKEYDEAKLLEDAKKMASLLKKEGLL